jgi:hypothetical protein
LIADTLLLLSLRWQLAWNRFKSGKAVTRVLTVLSSIVLALFVGGASALVGVGTGALLRMFPEQRLDAVIPGLLLAAVSFLLVLSSFGVALGSLFLTSDLDILMTAPVDRKAVFISKILDGMALYYAMAAVLALPALFTYGLAAGYSPAYYILALIVLLGTPLLPAGVASILVMLVARFAPARRVREILGVMGALFGIACGLIAQTSRFWMSDIAVGNGSADDWAAGLRGIGNLPLPPMMAGRGLAAAGMGDWGRAALELAAYALFTFGFFAVCIWFADGLYAAGWVRMQSSGSAKRGRQRAEQAARRGGLLATAPAYMAIVLKDWRVIPRDLRNFAQMLSPLVFLPVIYLNIVGGGRRGADPLAGIPLFSGQEIGTQGIFLAGGVLLASSMVFGRVSATAISREGKAWWLLKAAPVSGVELLRGKFLTAMIPFSILSTAMLFGAALWQGLSPLWTMYGWIGVELLGAGMLATELGFSVPWARLDWDDPRRMTSGIGSLFSLLVWLGLSTVGGGLLCVPVLLELFEPAMTLPAALLALALAAALTAGVSMLVLRFGLSRLYTVGEA